MLAELGYTYRAELAQWETAFGGYISVTDGSSGQHGPDMAYRAWCICGRVHRVAGIEKSAVIADKEES